ncbi:hypothetical protein ACFU5P_00915 [Streptomyces sp. NPDC057433]|uniref:hypothetical protein n=1 Tax=Streptomyces sp. NPDC057433 TaxID=3346132 RepID=UPI0036D12F4C
MAGKKQKGRGSPDSSNSDGSGSQESWYSAASSQTDPATWEAMQRLFQLPDTPPSSDRVQRAPRMSTQTSVDVESLTPLPQRDPWYSSAANTWLYVRDGRMLASVYDQSKQAYRWAAANKHTVVGALAAGGGALSQGAGILGQDPAAPSNTAGQAAYGMGTTLSTGLAAWQTVEGAVELYHRYFTRNHTPNRERNLANTVCQGVQTAAAIGYGVGASGALQDPRVAQLTQGISAVALGGSTMAQPFFQGTNQQQPTTAPPTAQEWQAYDAARWTDAGTARDRGESSREGALRGNEGGGRTTATDLLPHASGSSSNRRSATSESSHTRSRHTDRHNQDKSKGKGKSRGPGQG